MPGILGIIGGGRREERVAQVELMLSCMKHRPQYLSGEFGCENPRLRAAWTTHEDAFSAGMPVWNEAKDVCLIFSGEDFTDPSEIELLRSRGHNCQPDDPGYLVHLYEEKGPQFIEQLNGWFAGLLADFRRRRVILFNDRYGLGRIYFHQNSEGFYFSSEAKAILRVLPRLRELDLGCLAQIFSYGCVLGNRTLFKKISLLPPASRWIFDFSDVAGRQTYFTASQWENQEPLGPEEYFQELRQTFARILPRYLGGKRPVGMSLTGGLDGRMIMAAAHLPPVKLPCYTFGGPYRECCDVKIARRVAKLCAQSHETISVGPAFFREFPELAEKTVYISDGTMDVSGAVSLLTPFSRLRTSVIARSRSPK